MMPDTRDRWPTAEQRLRARIEAAERGRSLESPLADLPKDDEERWWRKLRWRPTESGWYLAILRTERTARPVRVVQFPLYLRACDPGPMALRSLDDYRWFGSCEPPPDDERLPLVADPHGSLWRPWRRP
jgi:hypothetical protein